MTGNAGAKARIVGVFDRSAPTYGQVVADFFEPAAADLVAAAGLRPGQRVLDVGCGRGANLFAAAAAVGPAGSVVGTDLAPAMVAATAAEARGRGLAHVQVRLGDAEAPDEPPGAFDAVLAGFVVFFLPDPLAAARAYHRLLRPGGRLALSTFCEVSERGDGNVRVLRTALAQFLPPPAPPAPQARPDAPPDARPDAPPPDRPDLRLRTRESLAELLHASGFGDVRFDERTYQVRFPSADDYWRWLWSHGARAALEQIPADRLDAARVAVARTATEMLQDPDGGLVLPIHVRLTTATAG
jgi:ubiquinone/menaquinone biosynthesis C-methylase UbiE